MRSHHSQRRSFLQEQRACQGAARKLCSTDTSPCTLRREKRAFPFVPPFGSPWLSPLLCQDDVLEGGERGGTGFGWYGVNFLHSSLCACCLPGLNHGKGKNSSSSHLLRYSNTFSPDVSTSLLEMGCDGVG